MRSNRSHELQALAPDMVAVVRRPSRDIPFVEHFGVAFRFQQAEWCAYDLTPDAGLAASPLGEWARGSVVGMVWHSGDPLEVAPAWTRLCRLTRCRTRDRYHLMHRNCEHLAWWVATGAGRSRQVESAALLTLLGLGLWFARRAAPG